MIPTTVALAELVQDCQRQIERFRLGTSRDSSSCDEILRRAADQNQAALGSLIEVSLPLIAKRRPSALRHRVDDLQQIVSERLTRKFKNVESPFEATSFAAYREYLNKTILSAAYDMGRRERQTESLDTIGDTAVLSRQVSEMDQVDKRMRLQRCMELLPNDRMRIVFRHRFVLEETTDETVASLRQQGLEVTKVEVFRLVERGIVYLSKLPEVREMFEADGGISS